VLGHRAESDERSAAPVSASPPCARAGAPPAWRAAPASPRLPDGAVHVWRAELAGAHPRLAELLCERERERAARLLRERDRVLWTHARGLLRALLGRYLRLDPRTLRFAAGPHGKPALPAQLALEFNLSHSGSLALYAFSRAGPVGVDVETDRRALDELALAERELGAHEAQRLRALADPAARRREFLRAWTRHEAAAKCLGTGIAAACASRERAGALWIAELSPGADAAGLGATAALACEQRPRELRCWRWEPQRRRGED